MDIAGISEQVEKQSLVLRQVAVEVEKVIVGQKAFIDRLLTGLLCNAHLLVEGLPGLAKTTAVKTLASAIDVDFMRIQFTPDLLPADILGTQIFRPDTGSFEIRKGPIFHNIILADEINRAPAKVQSALLEAMAERQITIGQTTFALDSPFMVLATQNPIEQEGTYPLPEAQVDRFMLKIKVDYPGVEHEKEIIRRVHAGITEQKVRPAISRQAVLEACRAASAIHMEEKIFDYIVNLVRATRSPKELGRDLANMIRYGASPRASIYLAMAARAQAFLSGRAFVTPQDVKTLAPDVLRHRIIVSYEAEAQGVSSDDIITRLLERIVVP
ncbi:MAG: MoxR family ATPase [Desulfatibacillaceae bacterium]|nr:MoxR family ATPase [Desulfatibacillaceae bacterium]